MKRISSCLALISISMGILAAEPEAILDELRAELVAVADKEAKDQASEIKALNLLRKTQSLLMTVPQGKHLTAELLAPTLGHAETLAKSAPSAKSQQLARELVKSLNERKATAQRAADEKAMADVRAALEAGLAASTAMELDAPLGILYRLRQKMNAQSRENRRESRHLEQVNNSVSLLEAIQGSILSLNQTPAESRQQLAAQFDYLKESAETRFEGLIPPSELIAKSQALLGRIFDGPQSKALTSEEFDEQLATIVRATKTFDDMKPAIAKIRALCQQQEARGLRCVNGRVLSSELAHFYDICATPLTGGELRLFLLTRRGISRHPELIADLVYETTRFSIAKHFKVPDDQSIKREEEIPSYLDRMLDYAVQKGDCELTRKVIGFKFESSPIGFDKNERNALALYAGAKRLEQAHQYSAAVDFYLKARMGEPHFVSLDLILNSLVAIKRDHPEEYEVGVNLSQNAPAR